MATIAYLSHQSEPLGHTASTEEAGLAHLLLYTMLGLLLLWALAGGTWGGRDVWLLPLFAIGLAVLFGLLDELHQASVRGRTASEADLAIDALGAGLGVSLGLLLAVFRRSFRRIR